MRRDRWREDAIAQSPAGHCIRFGKAVYQKGALRHSGQRGDAGRLSGIGDAPVDVVGHHPEIVALRQRGEPLQIVDHRAGGIARRVEDDHPRPRRDGALGGVEVEAVERWHRDGHAAAEAHHRRVDGKARIGDQHLVAGLDGGEHPVEDGGLGSGADHHLVDARAHAAPQELLADGLAQLRQPRGRTIAGVPVAQRPHAGLDDVRGRGKVRLADFEVEDPAPARFEGPRLEQDVERRFGSERLHARRELWHALEPTPQDAWRPASGATGPAVCPAAA